jgi:hypothetical protein
MQATGYERTLDIDRETRKNRENQIGFIAVHPRDGVFLGVEQKSGEAVFKPLSDLRAGQAIPAFFHQEQISTEACADTRILDCTAHSVRVGDMDREAAFAGEVRSPRDGTIIHTSLSGRDVYPPKASGRGVMRALSVANMKIQRATLLPVDKNRYYNAPLGKRPSGGAKGVAYTIAAVAVINAVPCSIALPFIHAAKAKVVRHESRPAVPATTATSAPAYTPSARIAALQRQTP